MHHAWPRLLSTLVAVVLTAFGVATIKRMLTRGGTPPASVEFTDRGKSRVTPRTSLQPAEGSSQPEIDETPFATQSPAMQTESETEYPSGWLEFANETDRVESEPQIPQNPPLSLSEPRWLPEAQPQPAEDVQFAAYEEEVQPENIADVPSSEPPTRSPTSPSSQSSVPVQPIYITRPNDSFWTISEERYGSGVFYIALYVHNRARIESPDRIPADIALETPTLEELRHRYPQHCPDNDPSTRDR